MTWGLLLMRKEIGVRFSRSRIPLWRDTYMILIKKQTADLTYLHQYPFLEAATTGLKRKSWGSESYHHFLCERSTYATGLLLFKVCSFCCFRISKVVINNPPSEDHAPLDLLISHTSKSMGQRIKENRKRVNQELREAAEDAVPSNALKGPEDQDRFVNCTSKKRRGGVDIVSGLKGNISIGIYLADLHADI